MPEVHDGVLIVKAPNGNTVEVAVPPDATAGQKMRVSVPTTRTTTTTTTTTTAAANAAVSQPEAAWANPGGAKEGISRSSLHHSITYVRRLV